MRILVHGAGAVGGYFGALLARGGHEVTFVARGENLAALRARGLTVRLGTETLHLSPVRAVADPGEAPRPDLVLVCVKSYDTPAAALALRPAVGLDTIVLSLQNGVENEDILARALGLPPLMVALTRIGVALVAPATVDYSGRGTILFGEPDGSESPRARRAAEAFAAAGVPYELRRDILVAAWEKLAWNAGFNAVTTLTRSTVAEVLAEPASRERGSGPALANRARARGERQRPSRLPDLDAAGPAARPPPRARCTQRRRGARRGAGGCGRARQPGAGRAPRPPRPGHASGYLS